MNDKQIEKLTRAPATSPNVLAPKLAGWTDGDKSLFLANEPARAIAQNLIDQVADHKHLRQAKTLVLFRTGQTANADRQVELGKASKASGLIRLLTGGKSEDLQADFVIRLNADQWHDMKTRAQAALVDHGLTHCAVTVAGKRFAETMTKKIRQFEQALGDDYIDTVELPVEEKVAVRFIKRKGPVKPGNPGYGDQPPAWRIRKHDVQEFVAIVDRHGAWDAALQQLVDAWEPDGDGQLTLDLKDDEKAA